jgi:hypothetical protein
VVRYRSADVVRAVVRAALVGVVGVVALLVVTGAIGTRSAPLTPTPTATQSGGDGYWLVASDGGIFSYGKSLFFGSTGATKLNQPIVGMAAHPDGKGYWFVAADGGIFNFGSASFFGSAGGAPLNKPIVGMAATPTGKGYWLVASDGGIFSYGDAAFLGSTGAIKLNQPIVGMAAHPDGKGYWFVAADGGIFNFGSSAFLGSAGAGKLNKPIVGMAATPTGKGYWLVASDGGIFSYGDAAFFGSTGAMKLNQPIVGMTAHPDGKGYWFVAADGGIFNFGSSSFFGSAGGAPLNKPIVGIATLALRVIGNEAPALNVSGPNDDAVVNDSTPTYTGASTDTDSTISRIEVQLDGGTFTSVGAACAGCGTANATWSYTPAALADGSHTLSFRAVDSDGAPSTVVTRTIVVDTVRPTVTVNQAAGQLDPTNTGPLNFTVTFSEPVSGFANTDVALSGTAGGTRTVALTGGPAVYTAAVSGMTDGTVIAAVPANAAADAAGNANTVATSTDPSVAFDTVVPTFDSINAGAGSSTVRATFSEPIACSTVSASDFTAKIQNSAAVVQSVLCQSTSDATIDLTLDSAPTGGKTVEATLASAVADPAGNTAATPVTRTLAISDVAPTLAVTAGPADNAATASNAPSYSGTAADSDGTVSAVQVTLDGTAVPVGNVTCTGCGTANATWTYTPNPVLADGAHVVRFDAVDDVAIASSLVTRNVTVDTSVPSVTINAAAAQADPTNASPLHFTAIFSEPVTGFTNTDVSIGGTAGGTKTVVVSGGPATYDVAVSGMTDGTVVAAVPAGAAADQVGHASTAATSADNSVLFDVTAPTVTVTKASAQADPTNGGAAHVDPINFTVTFSEPVTGFTNADVAITGTAGGTKTVTVTGTGPYNVAVKGMTDGTVVASVPAGGATDAAGNPNAASPTSTVTYDTTPPTFNALRVAAGSTTVTATFNELVACSSVTASDFTATVNNMPANVTNAACTPANDDTVDLTLATAPTGTQAVVVNLTGTVTDVAGNSSVGPASQTATAPQLSITAGPANGSTTNDTTPTYAGTAADTAPGVATVEAQLDNGGFTTTGVTGTTAWTFTPTAPLAAGSHTIDFRSVDAGGSLSALVSRTVLVDLTAPTVTINQAAGTGDPNKAPTFDVVFSEAVTGFDGTDVTITGTAGGTKTASVTGSGTTYTVAVNGLTTNGTVTASVPAGAAADAATNVSAASTSTDDTVTFDGTAPTVTIDQAAAQPDPSSGATVNFTAVFSEPVSSFDGTDVTLTGSAGGTKVVTVTGGPTTFNLAVSGMTDGVLVASIPAAGATDVAGNASAASTSTDNVVTFDGTRPTVTVNQGGTQADPTATSPLRFTVVFSEAVTGFTDADVAIGGTAGGTKTVVVGGSGTTYTVDVSGMTDGTVIPSVPAGGATDAAGNTNVLSTAGDGTVTFDTTGPTVTVEQAASPQADPTSATPIKFTVTFDEPVTGFDGGDVTIGGTAGGTKSVSVTGSASPYTVQVSGMTNGTVIASIAAAAVTDAVGNPSSASTSTDNSVTFDTAPPVFSSIGPIGGTNTVVAAFDEPILCASVASGDFTASVTNLPRTVSSVACTGTSDDTIGIVLSGAVLASTNGVSVTLAPSSVTDVPGTANAATPTTKTNAVPTLTVTGGPADTSATTNTTPTYSGTASDTASGTIAAVEVSVDGGAFSSAGTTGTASWSFTPTAPLTEAAHTFVFRARDDQGGLSPTQSRQLTVDNTAPTVTIDQASTQADPSNAATLSFTAVFSEAVTGFTNADVTVGGTAGGTKTVAVSGGPTTYTVGVSGMTTNGTVTVSLPAAGAADPAGNTSAAGTSTDAVVTFDGTTPTVTINQAIGQADPVNAGPIGFTVVFSEPVSGFTNGDVTVGGTAGGTKTVTVTGGPTTYGVTVSGMTDGTVIATVPAGGAADAAGNANAASTTTDNTVTFDATHPAVTVEQAATQAGQANVGPIGFTVTFAEPVTGFTNADVTVGGTAGGTKTVAVTGGPAVYDVAVSGMTTDGTVTASVAAGTAMDAAGNPNDASTSTDNSVDFDTTGPSVEVEQSGIDPTKAGPIHFTAQFDEPVTGFTNADVTITGTAGATTVAVTGGPELYDLAVSGMTSNGTVSVSIAATTVTDVAGNANPSDSTSLDNVVTYDTTAPTLVSVSPLGGTTIATANFDEPIACGTVAATDFNVTVAGVPRTVDAPLCAGASDQTIDLDLSGADLANGQLVSVTIPASAINDAASNAIGPAPNMKANAVPSLTVSSLADNVTVADTTPDFSGTASDTAPGTVALVEVKVDGGDFSVDGVGGTPSAWTFTPTTPLGEGAHTILFRATDDAGGRTSSAARHVTVDTTGPVFASISATGGDTHVIATFDEPVLCSTVADVDFNAKVGGSSVVVGNVACTGTSDDTIDVTLAAAPASGQTVAVTLVGTVTDTVSNTAAHPTTQSAAAA